MAKSYARVQLYIDTGQSDTNLEIFDYLFNKKDTIESNFGDSLVWQRLEGKKPSRIKYEMPINCYDKEEWNNAIEFMVDNMIKFEKAMQSILDEYKNNI